MPKPHRLCKSCRQPAPLFDYGLCRACLNNWDAFIRHLERINPDRAARIRKHRACAEQRQPLFNHPRPRLAVA